MDVNRIKYYFKKYQNTIYLKDEQEYKRISISNKGIISHRDITLGKEIGRKRQYVIDLDNHPNTLTFIRQGVFLGGIGFIPKSLNHYIVTENMPLLSMNPNYNKLFMTYLFESEAYYKNVILKICLLAVPKNPFMKRMASKYC